MQNNDLVSVVISTYNRPTNILMRAISSVLAQTYTNIELIVVNDCPDNKSLVEEIRTEIESVDRKIKYIVQISNFVTFPLRAKQRTPQQAAGPFVWEKREDL